MLRRKTLISTTQQQQQQQQEHKIHHNHKNPILIGLHAKMQNKCFFLVRRSSLDNGRFYFKVIVKSFNSLPWDHELRTLQIRVSQPAVALRALFWLAARGQTLLILYKIVTVYTNFKKSLATTTQASRSNQIGKF